MAAATPDPNSLADRAGYDEIQATLTDLEHDFDRIVDRRIDAESVTTLADALRSLHARIRVRHAAGYIDAAYDDAIPAHLVLERRRLVAEHSCIIGLIDRLVRMVDSIADRSTEDLDVFVLRGRELIAVLRRHEAEEDRLFYLAFWHDTGGEAGA